MASLEFTAAHVPCSPGHLGAVRAAVQHLIGADTAEAVLRPALYAPNVRVLHRSLLALEEKYRSRPAPLRVLVSDALRQVRRHSDLHGPRSCRCMMAAVDTFVRDAERALPAGARLYAVSVLEHPDRTQTGDGDDLYVSQPTVWMRLLDRLHVPLEAVTRCTVEGDGAVARMQLLAHDRRRFRVQLTACTAAQQKVALLLPGFCAQHQVQCGRAARVQAWPAGWTQTLERLAVHAPDARLIGDSLTCPELLPEKLQTCGVTRLADMRGPERGRADLALAELGPGWAGTLLELAACVTAVAR